jgi:glutamate dehydrogenase/leucine dehydrogenase
MSAEVREKNGVLGDAWKKRNRKGETCEEQLRRMCKDIAQDITDAKQQDYVDQPRKDITASDWMEGTYDIRYLVDREKRYLGAEILVAGGGPTIWVDTFREQVTGWWGTDRVQWYFQDNLGLNDYCEEMYGC